MRELLDGEVVAGLSGWQAAVLVFVTLVAEYAIRRLRRRHPGR